MRDIVKFRSWVGGAIACMTMTGVAVGSETVTAGAEQFDATPVFTPGFSDLMLMTVQPRHLKLFYAAKQKNWELAAFEMKGLRNSFIRMARAVPYYEGNDVKAAVEAIMATSMQTMESVLATGDAKRFPDAYEKLTAACNACHAYTERSFVVVKVPKGGQGSAVSVTGFRTSAIAIPNKPRAPAQQFIKPLEK